MYNNKYKDSVNICVAEVTCTCLFIEYDEKYYCFILKSDYLYIVLVFFMEFAKSNKSGDLL